MALPTLDATFASAADVPRRYMLAQWLVNELGSGSIADYITFPERYLWAKIAVAAGGTKDEAAYIGLPKQYAWKDIYDAVSGSSLGTIDWTEKQALGHIAAAYRGDTGTPENLATYIDWPWRYQVASIIASLAYDPWDSILNSDLASDIVAAYDFRDYDGSEVVSRVGPNLEVNNISTSSDGLVFDKTNSSWAFAATTVSCTYPFTMAYIAKTQTPPDIEGVTINCSSTRFGFSHIVFTRGQLNQGLMPYNGTDNQDTGYSPDGSEWYYFAVCFLNNGTVRYATRKISGDLNGTVAGSNGSSNFSGYAGVSAGFGSQSTYNTSGTYRSAFFINKSFSTESDMNDLFDILKNSADGLTLE